MGFLQPSGWNGELVPMACLLRTHSPLSSSFGRRHEDMVADANPQETRCADRQTLTPRQWTSKGSQRQLP